MFNKKDAELYINKLLKKHKIKVHAWSTSSCGHAHIKERSIKIPKPTNTDRFAVCLHEIFHVIGRKGSTSFQKEFYCDLYARTKLIELEYDIAAWDKRMKWHVLSRIAMAHNRGLNHSKILPDIKAYFHDIDFNSWLGNKVYIGHPYLMNPISANVQITKSLTKVEVQEHLSKKGLILEKSMADDSTNNKWIVRNFGEKYGPDFDNLPAIINHYAL
jgi:hypothetical protein